MQVPAISKHLKNIFEERELDEKVVVSRMEITTQHGAIADKIALKINNAVELRFKKFLVAKSKLV